DDRLDFFHSGSCRGPFSSVWSTWEMPCQTPVSDPRKWLSTSRASLVMIARFSSLGENLPFQGQILWQSGEGHPQQIAGSDYKSGKMPNIEAYGGVFGICILGVGVNLYSGYLMQTNNTNAKKSMDGHIGWVNHKRLIRCSLC
ncbi:MAG: hypothetical protein KDJ66_07450, partial [Nitratireductor sp.]|nr:hypothetical protein [Nitratireductor sp.]